MDSLETSALAGLLGVCAHDSARNDRSYDTTIAPELTAVDALKRWDARDEHEEGGI